MVETIRQERQREERKERQEKRECKREIEYEREETSLKVKTEVWMEWKEGDKYKKQIGEGREAKKCVGIQIRKSEKQYDRERESVCVCVRVFKCV